MNLCTTLCASTRADFHQKLSSDSVKSHQSVHLSQVISGITCLRLLEGAPLQRMRRLQHQPEAWTVGRPDNRNVCQPFVYRNAFVSTLPNYFEGPMLMAVWSFLTQPTVDFVSSMMIICHTESMCVIFSDWHCGGGRRCWSRSHVFRCFRVHQVWLVSGRPAHHLFRFKCFTHLGYQALAAQVASDQEQIFNK